MYCAGAIFVETCLDVFVLRPTLVCIYFVGHCVAFNLVGSIGSVVGGSTVFANTNSQPKERPKHNILWFDFFTDID